MSEYVKSWIKKLWSSVYEVCRAKNVLCKSKAFTVTVIPHYFSKWEYKQILFKKNFFNFILK